MQFIIPLHITNMFNWTGPPADSITFVMAIHVGYEPQTITHSAQLSNQLFIHVVGHPCQLYIANPSFFPTVNHLTPFSKFKFKDHSRNWT